MKLYNLHHRLITEARLKSLDNCLPDKRNAAFKKYKLVQNHFIFSI